MRFPFHFKEVPYRPSRNSDEIAISKRGRLSFTSHFVKTHGVTAKTRAYLFYDDDNKVMAISFSEEADRATFPVVLLRGGGAAISASQFFAANDIKPANSAGWYVYEQHRGREVRLPDVSIVFLVELEIDKDTAEGDSDHE